MDTEELIQKCQAITLEGEEADKFIFEGQMKEKGFRVIAGCLVGKILLARGINREGLKTALSQAWCTVRDFKIESLGSNVFMFKFTSEVDKKRVLNGGPWHFDRALIVLQEPKGIGSIKKQSFSHASFWIQIHNVPLMCMDTSIIRELGARVRRVEDIGTNAHGECFGEFVRIRVSVDITKPLKKLIVLKQEGEEDIPMPVVYERLPDFCFCCGCIGHQFRECTEYRGQQKEDLPFGPWLKAVSLADRTKLNRNKEKWSKEQEKSKGENSASESAELSNPCPFSPNPGWESGSLPNKDGREASKTLMEVGHVEQEIGNVDKGQGSKMRPLQIDDKKLHGTAKSSEAAGVKETKAGNPTEKRKLEGKGKEVGVGQETKQANETQNDQMSSEGEEVANELVSKKSRPKWKRWKNHAREKNKKSEILVGPASLKRLCNEVKGVSPEKKKAKAEVSAKEISNANPTKSLQTNFKLRGESTSLETLEVLELTIEDISAEAGGQPGRKQ